MTNLSVDLVPSLASCNDALVSRKMLCACVRRNREYCADKQDRYRIRNGLAFTVFRWLG
jgi:hypothetical protein